jgi:hypothetical protein
VKRLVLIAAVLALAVPATTLGATRALYGSLDGEPDSAAKLRVADGAKGTFVRSIAFKRFEVPCDGGHVAILRRAKLAGEIPVGGKRGFRERDDNGETVFKVSGEFNRTFGRASGTFRYSGSIEAADGVVRECDGGKMSWSARTGRD